LRRSTQQQISQLDRLRNPLSAGKNRAVMDSHQDQILKGWLALTPGDFKLHQGTAQVHGGTRQIVFERAFVGLEERKQSELIAKPAVFMVLDRNDL
jgi:hypothetical protein